MTAPQRAIPGSGSVRAQIAEVLRASHGQLRTVDEMADRLVPLVDSLLAAAKAEALKEAANNPDCFGPGVSVTTLRDRAAAYRPNPSSEETHRGR